MKAKTNKAIAKRFVVKRSKRNKTVKLLKRVGGQDHFNARESGNTTLIKRRDTDMTTTLKKNLLKSLPYC